MNKDFKKLAEELSNFIGETTEATKVTVVATKKTIVGADSHITETEDYNGIDVRPVHDTTIHCMEAIVDFTRYHKLNEFVSLHSEWDDEKACVVSYIKCHIF